jgi:hypothetical protein
VGAHALQIVPVLRSVGGTIGAGNAIVLEGTGLIEGATTVTIDGQAATDLDVIAIGDRGTDQQVMDATVPAGVGAGVVTVTTAGGSFTLRPGSTITTQAAVTPGVDVGDTLATATTLTLSSNSEVTVTQSIGDNAFGAKDVDLYQLAASAGDTLTVELTRLTPFNGASFVRLFDSTGDELAEDGFSGPGNSPRLAFFTLPAAGTYFIGVSGFDNIAYDPTSANSGTLAATGTYSLRVERLEGGGRSSLTGVTSTATSGFATRDALGSVNIGQTLTLTGTGLRSSDLVVFTTSESGLGARATSTTLTPVSVAGDGTSLQVVVPVNAASGMVRLARENAGRFLQVVPTLSDVDQGVNDLFHDGGMRLRGTGFVEGGSTIHFGAAALTDFGPSQGPNVGLAFVHENDGIDLLVPNGVPLGPISVSTLGGRSAAFPLAFTGIVATATSGTPSNAGLPSANPGQAITLQGSGFDATTDVVFRVVSSSGQASERVVRPTTVVGGGAALTVVVPADAVTAVIGVVGDQNAREELLQIVPVVTGVDVTSVAGNGSTANVTVTGAGFVEGDNTVYRFGEVTVVDLSDASTPDVGFGNDDATLTLPLTAEAFGTVTVRTSGGTSAPFVVNVTAVESVALSGTPANAAAPSANPGQTVTVRGTGLRTTTDIVVGWTDSSGSEQATLVNPSFAAADGTEARFVVPDFSNGVFPVWIAGAATGAAIQVVPVVASAAVAGTGTPTVRLQGSGFVEGDGSVYTMGGVTLPDTSVSAGPNVISVNFVENKAVDLTPPVSGFGTVTVTTAGGTSAPIPWDVLAPGQGDLVDIAFAAAAGEILVASSGTGAAIHRVDPATAALLGSFAIPGGNSTSLGLQILPAAIPSLGGSAVAAGNLLVTNGGASFDKIFAVNPTTGAVMATLDLGQNLNPVAGVFHQPTGHLFVLDDSPNEVVELDPATGGVVRRFTTPFDISSGGLAVHPDTGNLWIGSSTSNSLAEVTPTGTLVRTVDLSQFGDLDVSGLAFRNSTDIWASSTRGLVYLLPDPQVGIAEDLTGVAGRIVTVPVLISSAVAGPERLESAEIVLAYDTTLLDTSSADVRVGAVAEGGRVEAIVDEAAGTIRLQVTVPELAPTAPRSGAIVEIDFRIVDTAAVQATAIDVQRATVNDGRGLLGLVTPAPRPGPDESDGLLTIAATASAPSNASPPLPPSPSWWRHFVLDLVDETLDPNRDLRIELAGVLVADEAISA